VRQMRPADAENLSPAQAADLVRVLDLQARWENHRDDPATTASCVADLQIRQRAHDAFQAALREYAGKHRNASVPETTQNMPDRLAIWCRALLAVCRRAESQCPANVMVKVYRLADRIAARTGKEPASRGTADELDAVIAWCDSQAA
jgi:hypothetical protein